MYVITGLLLARIVMLMPMFIKTLSLALLFVSGSAFAEWQFVIESSAENKFFIDPTTIRKDGNMRTAWEKVEKKNPDENGMRSYRLKFKIDCKKELFYVLAVTSFAEPNLMGKMLLNENYPIEVPVHIAPQTDHSAFMQLVCK
jgi:hypothetical protein